MTSSERQTENRTTKEQHLLDCALDAFLSGTFGTVKMADIAAKCGYAKGIVFYYFKSKENVFLRLLEREYDRRREKLTSIISRKKALTFSEFSEIILDELRETLDFESPFMRLLGLTNMLVNNVTEEALVEFKRKTEMNSAKLIELVSSRVHDLSNEKCMNIFYTENALLSGYNELANISRQRADVFSNEEFEALRIDYRELALQSMRDYLNGICGQLHS